MSKHKNHLTFAITVSPAKNHIDLEDLKPIVIKYLGNKMFSKWAYALEMGKNGDHPHTHMCVELVKPKRLDHLRRNVINFFSKAMEHEKTPNLVKVTVAHKPLYFITQYMQKEEIDFCNKGYDIILLKAQEQTERQRYLSMGTKRFKLTRSNILDVYEETWPKVQSKYTCYTPDGIKDWMEWLRKNGFDISFIVWNMKQVRNIILFSNGYTIYEDCHCQHA